MRFGANLLSSFAMGFVGGMVTQSFFAALGGLDGESAHHGDGDGAEANASDASPAETELDDDGDSFEDGGDMGDFDV